MIAKTPNKQRKSFANAEGETQSPKAGKVPTPQKTPGKAPVPQKTPGTGPALQKTPGKGPTPQKTPGKGPTPQKTPGKGPTPQKTFGKGPSPQKTFGKGPTPQRTPGQGRGRPNQGPTPQRTPGQGRGRPNSSPGKFNKSPRFENAGKSPQQQRNQGPPFGKKFERKNNKRPNESAAADGGSPKKVKKFEGTAGLQGPLKKPQAKKPAPQKGKSGKQGGEKKHKTKGTFFYLRERISTGDKAALEDVEAKLKKFEERAELTKTAKRKIKYLQRMKAVLTGAPGTSPIVPVPKSEAMKRRERQQKAMGAAPKKQVKGKLEQQKKTATLKVAEDADEAEKDSDESEDDSGITAGLLLKAGEDVGEEESDDESGEEEEESDEGEEEEEEEEDDSDDDEEEEEEEEEVPHIQKGGKKQGQDKKNEVKAKNFKLQAMRRQGQLAGSAKPGQKRSARRAKGVKANGSN